MSNHWWRATLNEALEALGRRAVLDQIGPETPETVNPARRL